MKIRFSIFYLLMYTRTILTSLILRFGSYILKSWYYIDNDSICTTGKVLKLGKIYAYDEGDNLEIVRLTNVHFERGYLYCSLFFFSNNQIITVRHTLLKGTKVAWRLLDLREYDELVSMRLWHEVSKEEELLDFDF